MPVVGSAIAADNRGPWASGHTMNARLLSALVGLIALAPLVLATFLTPSSQGHGTHSQLGMPPCGWAMYFGKPCVTCGMTTSFAHAVRLELSDAALVQPFALLLVVLSGVVFWAALYATLTGSDALVLLLRNLVRPRVIWSLALGAGLAWGYKWITWPTA